MAAAAETEEARQIVGTQADLSEPAPKRFAIVIGNGDYRQTTDLKNARADAQIVADFLLEHEYQVLHYTDLDKRGFEEMMRRLLYDLDKDSEVVFYFSGHGLQTAGHNYLIPADADFDDPYDLPFEAISLASILNVLGSRARIQIVILDSCRANPFAGSTVFAEVSRELSETQEGFSTPTTPVNTLLAFSTAPGAIAWDGLGENSPFTGALVEVARQSPERPVSQILEEVRRLVHTRTAGQQTPWETSSLMQSVSFGVPAIDPGPDSGEAETELGKRRSWINVTMAQAEVINKAEEMPRVETTAPLAISARLEHAVDLGSPLSGLEMKPPVTIKRAPKHGRLVVQRPDGLRVDALRQQLTAESLATLMYEPEIEPRPVRVAAAEESESFAFAAGGEIVDVSLSLEPDPCDLEAGDHLDPEGMGIARYPNEIVPEAALDACQAAVEAFPEVGRFHYQLGRAHLALRDLEAARSAFERARDLGHTRAWYALGLLLASAEEAKQGFGETAAPPAALALYERGVEAGDPYAFHALGKQLLRHGGSEAERQRGFELLERAVALGHTFAMNELGIHYIDPNSPESDSQRGLRYWEESAARGDVYGYHNLGVVYRDGLAGVEPDLDAAVGWLEKAAAGGHPASPAALGRLWNSGALEGEDADAKAIAWYDTGLERGDGWSGANAAWIIANRSPAGFTARDAALRAAKAAALRDEEAAAAAREVLASLGRDAVDGAAQMLLNELGASLAVDGSFGPRSSAEMERVLSARGAAVPTDSPQERLIGLARLFWEAGTFRVDLY